MLSNQSSRRNAGSATKLKGRCVILNLFLKDEESAWSIEEKTEVAERFSSACRFIETAAKEYQIHIEFVSETLGFEKDIEYPGFIPTDIFENPYWTEYTFEIIGLKCGNKALDGLKKKYRADHALTMFHINKQATSYNLSYHAGVDFTYHAERNVMFYCYENGLPTVSASYAHEILHSFGAGELYFPFDESRERFEIAASYFPNDIMLKYDPDISNLSISEYTAYRIGWIHQLDKKYRVFEDVG